MSKLVRDLAGRPVFYFDEGGARDVNGAPAGEPTDDVTDQRKLTELAACWLNGGRAFLADDPAGRKVLMDLGQGEVVTPSTQAEFGIPIATDCVADRVSAVRFVKHDRGVVYVENAADAISLSDPGSQGGGGPAEISPGYKTVNFTTEQRALAVRVPRRLASNADWDVTQRALRRLIEALRLWREQKVATLLTTTTNWAAGNQIAATSKWNGGLNPAPLVDLFAGLQASYLPVTHLVLGENVMQYFFSQPPGDTAAQLRDYVQAGGELPPRIIARQKRLIGTPAYIWSPNGPGTANNVPLVRCPSDPTSIPTSITLRWLGKDGSGGSEVEGVLVRKFWAPQDDATWLTVVHNDAEIMPSNQVGALIVGATQ